MQVTEELKQLYLWHADSNEESIAQARRRVRRTTCSRRRAPTTPPLLCSPHHPPSPNRDPTATPQPSSPDRVLASISCQSHASLMPISCQSHDNLMSISCQSHVNPRISLQVRRVRQTMQQLREENALIVRQLAAKGVSLDESTSQALGGVGMVVPPSPAARRGLGGSVATPRGGEGSRRAAQRGVTWCEAIRRGVSWATRRATAARLRQRGPLALPGRHQTRRRLRPPRPVRRNAATVAASPSAGPWTW